MRRIHLLMTVPLMLVVLFGCSARPDTFQSGLEFPSEPAPEETYSGPKFVLVNVSKKNVAEALDQRLKKAGFRRIDRGPNHRTYQIDDTGHDVVKRARVSFRFKRKGDELLIFTRALAKLNGFTLFEDKMTDVSDRKPARKRFRKLFRQVKSTLRTQNPIRGS